MRLSQTKPTPVWNVHDTESGLCCGWLGVACNSLLVLRPCPVKELTTCTAVYPGHAMQNQWRVTVASKILCQRTIINNVEHLLNCT